MPPSFIDRIFNGENLLPFVKTVTIASMGIAAGFLLSYNAMIMPALRKFSASSAVSVWAETAHGAMCKRHRPRMSNMLIEIVNILIFCCSLNCLKSYPSVGNRH